jgi:hypothetical protein
MWSIAEGPAFHGERALSKAAAIASAEVTLQKWLARRAKVQA